MVKSKDACCDEDNGNDSKPYSNDGMHLLIVTSWAVTHATVLPLPKDVAVYILEKNEKMNVSN